MEAQAGTGTGEGGMNKRVFLENSEGVHLETDPLAMRATKKRVVTCPRCIAIIEHCKGVRYRKDGG